MIINYSISAFNIVSVFFIFIFGYQIFRHQLFFVMCSLYFFFNITHYSYTTLYGTYTHALEYNTLKYYKRFLNRHIIIDTKNNDTFQGKLIDIQKKYECLNSPFEKKYTYLIFSIYVKKNITIEYKLNIEKINNIKVSKIEYYNTVLDTLFEESIYFKKIDIYLKNSIKDFLYIDNND